MKYTAVHTSSSRVPHSEPIVCMYSSHNVPHRDNSIQLIYWVSAYMPFATWSCLDGLVVRCLEAVGPPQVTCVGLIHFQGFLLAHTHITFRRKTNFALFNQLRYSLEECKSSSYKTERNKLLIHLAPTNTQNFDSRFIFSRMTWGGACLFLKTWPFFHSKFPRSQGE
jgi:hypothetical protein